MGEFFEALQTTSFLRNALLTGMLASVACGVVGTYVVARRITYVAGGIAHCVLGGIGAAVYLNEVHQVTWLSPLTGATIMALLAALIIGVVSLRCREREDTVISVLWASGMAAGVMFIVKTPGYQQDLMSYLFGNILMVSGSDLWLIGILDVVILVMAGAFYKQFLGISFDEEFARTRGINVEVFYLMLLVLTALTVVLLVTVVGIVLVVALLTLPVASAGRFARHLWQMMMLAVALSLVLTTAGLALSYGPDLPSGALTILLGSGLYVGAMVLSGMLKRGKANDPSTRQNVADEPSPSP